MHVTEVDRIFGANQNVRALYVYGKVEIDGWMFKIVYACMSICIHACFYVN
jgi:hypothetical protein